MVRDGRPVLAIGKVPYGIHYCCDAVNEDKMEWLTSLIDDFVEAHPGVESGPGHIVLADYNLQVSDVEYCLGECEKLIGQPVWRHGGSRHFATWKFLRELLDKLEVPVEDLTG
jgi:hypothetical protein